VSLRDEIQTELTAAMRSGNELRRDTLRMVTSAAQYAEKNQRRPLSDDEFLSVLAREVKTRRESVEAFRGGGREDLATKEEAEIAILQGFLPAALSEDELRGLVDEAVRATNATTVRDLGKVMGYLVPKTRGRADGKRLSELAAQALAATDLAGHAEKAH
jgi:uncharacterized protein YqeY